MTQTLPGEDPDFDLFLIEPASASRRVMDRESAPDFCGHFGAEDIGQRLPAMDIEVVHHEMDGLGFRVFQGQGDDRLSELEARTGLARGR